MSRQFNSSFKAYTGSYVITDPQAAIELRPLVD